VEITTLILLIQSVSSRSIHSLFTISSRLATAFGASPSPGRNNPNPGWEINKQKNDPRDIPRASHNVSRAWNEPQPHPIASLKTHHSPAEMDRSKKGEKKVIKKGVIMQSR
jgi:hypothetical protein